MSTLNYCSENDFLSKKENQRNSPPSLEKGNERTNEKNKTIILEKKTNRLTIEGNYLRRIEEDDFCKTKMIVYYLSGYSLPLSADLLKDGKAKAILTKKDGSKTELTTENTSEEEGQAILKEKQNDEYNIEVCFGNVSSFNNYFTGEKKLKEVKIEKFGSSKSNFEKYYESCAKLSAFTIPDSAIFTGSRITKMDQMFRGCSRLSSLDLSKFGVDEVVTFTGVAEKCNKLLYLSVPSYSFTLDKLNEFIGEKTRNLAALDLGDITIPEHSNCKTELKNLPKPTTTYLIANEATKKAYANCFGEEVDKIQNIPRKVEETQFGTYVFGNQCPVSKTELEVAYFFANGVFLCQESCSDGNITFIRKDDKTFCISYVENTNKTIRFNPKKETVSLETKKPKETFSWNVTNAKNEDDVIYELYCDDCPKGYFMYVNRTKYTWCRKGTPNETELASYVRSDGQKVYLDKDNCFGTVNETDGNSTCNECDDETTLYKSGDYINNTCTKDQPNNTLLCRPENYDPYFVDKDKCPKNYMDYYSNAGANLTGCVEKCDLLFTNSTGNEVCVDKCPDGYVKYMNKSNVTLCKEEPKPEDKPLIPYIKKDKPTEKPIPPPATPAPPAPPAPTSSNNPPAPTSSNNPPASSSPGNPPASSSPGNPPASSSPGNPPASSSPKNPPASSSPGNPISPAAPEEEEEYSVDIDEDSCPGLLKFNKSGIVACVDECSRPALIYERNNGTETCEVDQPKNTLLCEPIKEDPYYVEGNKCPKDYMEFWVNGKIEKCLEKCCATIESATAKCNCTGDGNGNYTYMDRNNCTWCKDGNPEDDDLIPYIRSDGKLVYIDKDTCKPPRRIYKKNNTCLYEKDQPKDTYIYEAKDGKEYYVDTCPGDLYSDDGKSCKEEDPDEIEITKFFNLGKDGPKMCFEVEVLPRGKNTAQEFEMKVNSSSGEKILKCNFSEENKVCKGEATYVYYKCCSNENYDGDLKDIIYENTIGILSQISSQLLNISKDPESISLEDLMERRWDNCFILKFDFSDLAGAYKTDREHFYFDCFVSSTNVEIFRKINEQKINDGEINCRRFEQTDYFNCTLTRELPKESSTLRLLKGIDIKTRYKNVNDPNDPIIYFKEYGLDFNFLYYQFESSSSTEFGHYETNRKGSGLNAGAIVAIVLSVLFVFGLIIFLVLIHKRDKNDKKQDANQGISAMANTNSNIKIGN